MRHIRSRPEAGPIPLKNLTNGQRSALDRVADWLHQSLVSLGTDRGRASTNGGRSSNRLMFLSSEPGTGKSSLYHTLRVLTENSSELQANWKRYGGTDDELSASIERLCNRLIWLEPLDMEPLAGDTNFLAAVLVRVEAALDGAGLDLASASSPHGVFGATDDDDLMTKLHELEVDLALSWRSRRAEHMRNVDPDTEAAEIRRGERARLGVRSRVNWVLSRLADRIQSRRNSDRPPIFLLPVDDFYLDPSASMELLRLLRMIAVPHLHVLMLGDIELVEQLMWHKVLGEHAKVLGPQGRELLPDSELDGPLMHTRAVAMHALRKLIPPAQRVVVEPITSIKEAVFHEILDSEDEQSGPKQLGALLNCISLDGTTVHVGEAKPPRTRVLENSEERARMGLGDYLWSVSDEGVRPGTPADLLEAPPRALLDLALQLLALREPWDWEPTYGPLVELIGNEFNRALDEQTRFDPSDRARCWQGVWASQGDLELAHTIQPQYFVAEPAPDKEGRYNLFLKATASSPESRKLGPQLPPRVAAWLFLLHEVLAINGSINGV